MKIIKIFGALLVLVTIHSCKKNDNTKSEKTNSIEVQEKLVKTNTNLILTENSLGELKLEKDMPLEEENLKELFKNYNISKNIGEQDGPNYIYYKIGTAAILTTPNTENEALSELRVDGKSKVSDEYGIGLGVTYNDIKVKRPDMTISTEHYRIYLSKTDSHIAYEMSLGDYNGPDKEQYTLNDINTYKSKVISIIWK